MKTVYKVLALSALAVGLFSCSKWTTPEQKNIIHIGGYQTMNNQKSDAYYKKLREYKEGYKNYGRPVAFGWFSGWSPNGTSRKSYLSAVPDSMDIISMWSGAPGRFTITPEQKKDKEFAQKVMGIKLLEVSLLSHLGKGRTPESIYKNIYEQAAKEKWSEEKKNREMRNARWDYWGFKSHNLSNMTELKASLAKYAKALCDSLIVNEWDGFDIDWEPGIGFNDEDGTLNNTTIVYLIQEMSKYIGPKSDPEGKGHKLLCIDGIISVIPAGISDCIDYFIEQDYGRVPNSFNPPGGDPRKLIITDNFESSFRTGGVLLKQAAAMPNDNYKGGVGAYRFDQDYNNWPDYKFMRQAIRINQEVFNKWKASQGK